MRDVGRLSRNPANSCLTLAAKARAAASLLAKQAEDLFRWQQSVVLHKTGRHTWHTWNMSSLLRDGKTILLPPNSIMDRQTQYNMAW